MSILCNIVTEVYNGSQGILVVAGVNSWRLNFLIELYTRGMKDTKEKRNPGGRRLRGLTNGVEVLS